MPVIVRTMDDDEATIMVASNLQRETLLPSERVFAYQTKIKTIKCQGERQNLMSCQVGTRLRVDEKIAKSVNERKCENNLAFHLPSPPCSAFSGHCG